MVGTYGNILNNIIISVTTGFLIYKLVEYYNKPKFDKDEWKKLIEEMRLDTERRAVICMETAKKYRAMKEEASKLKEEKRRKKLNGYS
jgi:hypothetical protein